MKTDLTKLFKDSWDIVKRNYVVLFLILVVMLALNIVHGFVAAAIGNLALSYLLTLVFGVIALILQIGVSRILLKLVDGKGANINELWDLSQYNKNVITGALIFALIFVVPGVVLQLLAQGGFNGSLRGLIALILEVGQLYLLLRMTFFLFLLVDKNLLAMDALRQSWKLTEGKLLTILAFLICCVVVAIIGALALVVGLLVAIPIIFVSSALLYRRLT